MTFRRQSFAESDDRIQEFVPGGGQDRLYRVSSFQILGPFNPTGLSDTPSRDKIFVCHPNDGADPSLCAEEIITALATRAYRRPIGEEDLSELLAYFRDGTANVSARAGNQRRAAAQVLELTKGSHRVGSALQRLTGRQ